MGKKENIQSDMTAAQMAMLRARYPTFVCENFSADIAALRHDKDILARDTATASSFRWLRPKRQPNQS